MSEQKATARAVLVAACDDIGGQIAWTHEEVADRLLAALHAAGFVVERSPAVRERERRAREFMQREAGYHVG